MNDTIPPLTIEAVASDLALTVELGEEFYGYSRVFEEGDGRKYIAAESYAADGSVTHTHKIFITIETEVHS